MASEETERAPTNREAVLELLPASKQAIMGTLGWDAVKVGNTLTWLRAKHLAKAPKERGGPWEKAAGRRKGPKPSKPGPKKKRQPKTIADIVAKHEEPAVRGGFSFVATLRAERAKVLERLAAIDVLLEQYTGEKAAP